MSATRYPFGEADIIALSATGAQALTLENGGFTILDGATVTATGNRSIALTLPDDGVPIGTEIFVKVKTTATETTTFGTGFSAPVITGVAGKTFCQEFRYDGITFKPKGSAVQID